MKLTVTSSPHIRGDFRTSRLMLDVVIALVPSFAVGVLVLGIRALWVTVLSMATAVAAEWLWSLLLKKRNTLPDCSALVTGMLFALTLPATTPYWVVAFGSAFAIIVVKLMCGGLGQNIFNPALMARAVVMLLWPASITRYAAIGVDGVTASTPLHHMVMPALPEESVMDMFLGLCPGSIGDLSAWALIAGGIYLVARRGISARIPVAYLGTVAVLTLVFHKTDDALSWMLYSLFSGGRMLGAIFMATDYVTSPITKLGQIVYGIGCGALTVMIRYFGSYNEGVSYAILVMNACVVLLDRIGRPTRYGAPRKEAAKK